MLKKQKLPDFKKMSESGVIHWFETHDTGKYVDQNDIIDLDDDEKNTMLNVRLSRSVKRILERLASTKGLRGASTYARQVLTEVAKEAA